MKNNFKKSCELNLFLYLCKTLISFALIKIKNSAFADTNLFIYEFKRWSNRFGQYILLNKKVYHEKNKLQAEK
jgi:hypothetical protein